MANYFDLLNLADGESGEAAVAKVVDKNKTADAKKAEEAADPKPNKGEPARSQYPQHQHGMGFDLPPSSLDDPVPCGWVAF